MPALRLPGGGLRGRGTHHPAPERRDQADSSAKRMNSTGATAAIGRLPADQRLDAVHVAGRDIDDRLVMQHELLLFERLAQVRVEPHVLRDLLVHLQREHAIRMLALFLRDVHRGIRAADQRLERIAVLRMHRDADRAARVDLHQPEMNRRAQPFENDLRGRFEQRPRAVLEQHEKFVAAEPRERRAGRQAAADDRRHVLQQPVAGDVPVVIVDALEVVEIEEQDADLPARRGGLGGDRRVDALADRMAIRQAGQHVGVRGSMSRCCALRSSVMSMPEQIRNCSSTPLPLCTNLLRNWNRRGPLTVLM